MSDKIIRTNSRLPKSFGLIVMLVVLLTSTPVMAQDAPTLRWELVNPFRFIHHQDTVDELKRVYAEPELNKSETPAYDLERALQKRSEEEVDRRRAEARTRFNCDDRKATAEEKRRCFEPYEGWFARLSQNNYSKTCWNSATRQFRTDVNACRDYIYPESHKVRVWIENPQLPGGPPTAWFIDGRPITDSKLEFKNCDANKDQQAACVEISVPYDAVNPRKIMVSVRLSDGGTIALPKPIEVVDRLVVGLGDSYAAGEGNPDSPARFTQGERERDFLPDLLAGNIPAAIRGTRRPQKDRGSDGEARWLDRRCHRSMYSYQFKTALQLALSNPQEAVTYVSYSCSGATTGEIVNVRAKAIEGGGRVDPQLDSLREVLSKGGTITREIDYLLLSTGGNDIEFGQFVAYAVLSGRALNTFKRLKGIDEQEIIKRSNRREFENRLLGQDGNYLRLHKALLDAPLETESNRRRQARPNEAKRIKIKGCQPGGPCPRIILTPYPDILHDQAGKLCKADRKEFDNPFGQDATRASRLDTLNTHVFRQIRDVQRNPLITSGAGLGWTVAEGNVEAYSKHGFCAQAGLTPLPLAETFELPRWVGAGWTPFNPPEYRPFTSRLRWVRLPIDAKLTTDQMRLILRRFSLDFFLEDDRSVIMHPTAEGLAATADANFIVIQKLAGASR